MKMLSFDELQSQKGIRYTRRHLTRKCDAGEFPRPVRLGGRRIAWCEDEIDEWLLGRIAERDAKAVA